MLGVVALLLSLLALDRLFPPPLLDPAYARVVLDMKGRPLRAFADTSGVWRYPVTLEQVSPRYIEALLGYEDRYFWRQHLALHAINIRRANLSSRKCNQFMPRHSASPFSCVTSCVMLFLCCVPK